MRSYCVDVHSTLRLPVPFDDTRTLEELKTFLAAATEDEKVEFIAGAWREALSDLGENPVDLLEHTVLEETLEDITAEQQFLFRVHISGRDLPDAVICDIQLPHLSTFEHLSDDERREHFAQEVRKQRHIALSDGLYVECLEPLGDYPESV